MTGSPLPRHVAMIMDGNGRWARSRGWKRLRGHQQGAEALRKVARHAARLGIPELTFFALSTENYCRRPRVEIEFLMDLLVEFLVKEREELAANNIRLKTIGRIADLPRRVQEAIEATVSGSARHTGMVLRLALNYGGRQEILDGLRDALSKARAGLLDPGALDEASFRRFLYDPDMPDPDLLIRTAGEIRLSNFLLWQASYTEVWATDVLWPDFDVPHFDAGLRAFAARARKFGSLEPVASAGTAGGAPAGAGQKAPVAVRSGTAIAGG